MLSRTSLLKIGGGLSSKLFSMYQKEAIPRTAKLVTFTVKNRGTFGPKRFMTTVSGGVASLRPPVTKIGRDKLTGFWARAGGCAEVGA
ncbi:hypothetical protein Ocin01_17409 [Orchesella cincta]|uniref:Uncharacterized protein n=1 Tax=Orchesella cincta TaxID=48709 RepID=A0A1D2M8L1_ORCCI|nr:hypothetical protein Ocin01_17409 [Orchesella cincta]